MLMTAYYALSRKAAAGVDGMKWAEYGQNLEARLLDLHDRVQRGRYVPQPSRRTYIPKADGRQRPLAVAAREDKIVQGALVMVLNAVYEEHFLGFSYGFRPGRGPHDALDALAAAIDTRKVNFIVDADIRSFFETEDQKWLIRFVEHRIGDRRIVRLIGKWLRAGVLEDGHLIETEEGTPQGAVISPLLANIYLHHVYDQWVHQWRQRCATGDVIVVRYADDSIVGFEHRYEAEQFLADLKARLARFCVNLPPEQTA